MSRGCSPPVIFLAVAAVIVAAMMGMSVFLLDLSGFWAYLLSINTSMIVLYIYDKSIAGTTALRVPERVLLLVAAAGGSVGAMLGQELLRHKVAPHKYPFRRQLSAIALVHVVLFTLYKLLF